MKKIIAILLSVLCLTLVITTSVSAGGGVPSFSAGGIEVVADDNSTALKSSYDSKGDWPEEVGSLVSFPTVSGLASDVPGFPSTSSNDVTLVGSFFEVYGASPKFTVTSDKIVAGVQVGLAHLTNPSAGSYVWEFNATSIVDPTNHTASFSLTSASPVILVVYKAKTTPAPSGVVNTATK